MFDTYWAPTELAREALGSSVISAVPIYPHAGAASRGEKWALVGLFAAVVFVARFFPWWVPIGPSLASAFIALTFMTIYWVRRSWAWHLFRGERHIIGQVAVFFSDRVEVHDKESIDRQAPIATHPIHLVHYSGFTDWANPRLRLGERSWATDRRYRPYISAALTAPDN